MLMQAGLPRRQRISTARWIRAGTGRLCTSAGSCARDTSTWMRSSRAALRVVETISGVIEGPRLAVEPTYDPRAYNASPETLLEILREADDTVERLLIVGHNPGLQHLLLLIAEDDRDGLRGNVALRYPTAAWPSYVLRSIIGGRRAAARPHRRLVRPRDVED